MAKDAYYFQHDSNAHNDPKMLALRIKTGWEGIGLYWTFLEILRDMPAYKYAMTNGYLTELELRLSHPKATLEAWLNEACAIGLLAKKDGFLYSESFLRRMQEIDERRAVLSEAGRRGGLNSRQAKGRLKPPLSSKEKKSKEEKSKVSKISKEEKGAKAPDPEVFVFLKNQSFAQLWESWLEVRTKKRVPNTIRALEIALKKLHGWEMAKAEEALKQAVEKGWRGIFEPKDFSTREKIIYV